MRKMLERIGARLGYKYIRYGAFWRRYFRAHKPEIERLKALLADEKSVEVLDCVIKFRKTRNLKYLKRVAERRQVKYSLTSEEQLEYNEMQYFPQGLLKLSDNEVFIDGGGYFGDSTVSFIEHVSGRFKKIHIFEAVKEICETLQRNINYLHTEKPIIVHNVGLYSSEKEVYFSQEASSSKIDVNGTSLARLVALDTYLSEEERSEITYIKMDIEGAETEALKGMAQTIAKYKPKLAICIYHLPDDLWQIPEYIHSLNPDYKLYIRHHDVEYGAETVCYAIP